jgi:hypothetical protein
MNGQINTDTWSITALITHNEKLSNQLQMCEWEVQNLSYKTANNISSICEPIKCEKSYIDELNACDEREKNNAWFVYSWKIFDRLCKEAQDNTQCAKIYYDFLYLNK